MSKEAMLEQIFSEDNVASTIQDDFIEDVANDLIEYLKPMLKLDDYNDLEEKVMSSLLKVSFNAVDSAYKVMKLVY